MKKNIAILAGGNSPEREISLKSASMILENIDSELFNPYIINIHYANWTYVLNEQVYPINKNDFSLTIQNQSISFDCALIMIHGTPGEDGKLQSYFELMKIPYTTCDVLTSALTANKYFCKRYLHDFGVLMAKSLLFFRGDEVDAIKVNQKVGYPCFVKPNNGGSSTGASKVSTAEQLMTAMEKAFAEDEEVIVEEFIAGRELTCGLMLGKNATYKLPLCEVVSKNEFFDYEAKYTDGKSDEIIPALVSLEISENCQKLSEKIYKALKCRGIVRIDYILCENQLYFLEVNTIPGMSKNSIVPKMLRNEGVLLSKFLTDLLNEALTEA